MIIVADTSSFMAILLKERDYGDLFSYSLAKQRSLPLLFKGDDFSKTDIVSCL